MTETHTPDTRPEILISNLSLPKDLIAWGSITGHERYMRTIEADGLELTPTYIGRFMGRLNLWACIADTHVNSVRRELAGKDKENEDDLTAQTEWVNPESHRVHPPESNSAEDEAYRRLLRSLHSSFRKGDDDRGILASNMPTWQQSLGLMSYMQAVTGPLPAVLYPEFKNGTVAYTDAEAPFAERTFQPTPVNWLGFSLLEISEEPDIRSAIGKRGFTGITWDVFHAQREFPSNSVPVGGRFRDPLRLGSRLAMAGLVSGIHLSLNRIEITGLRGPLAASTRQARRAFIRSADAAGRTLEGEMLQQMVKDQPAGPAPAVRRIVLEDGPYNFSARTRARDQAAIIAHTRELVDAALSRSDRT